MPVKSFIKNHPRLAHNLHQLRFFSWRPSSVNSTRILENLARRRHTVSFVQIGSNDGVTGDPLHSYIRGFGWRGVLVEPLPEVFSRLRQNYAGCDGLNFENSVISSKEGKCPIYTLREINGDHSSQVSSLLFEVIAKQREFMPDFSERFAVRYLDSLTTSALFDKFQITNLELLHIDAEGYDFEILKMLDFARIKPTIIIFESEHLEATTYRECLDFLAAAGYKIFFRDGHDTITLKDAEFL